MPVVFEEVEAEIDSPQQQPTTAAMDSGGESPKAGFDRQVETVIARCKRRQDRVFAD